MKTNDNGTEAVMIAPCGMDCRLCVGFQMQKFDLKKKGFHRKYCSGCLPRGKGCLHMDDQCGLLRDGKVRFCFECAEFPCRRLKALDKRYRTKYHMSMIENLECIRDNGIEAFLDRQETQWGCEKCGEGKVCCHNGLCLACETDVLRRNHRYRWGEQQTVRSQPRGTASE